MLTAGSKDVESITAWRNDMQKKSPTFMYWDLIMMYETLILIFVRAHREKNLPLYVKVLEELTPLFFALDHVNYSLWVPVHIRDMKSLPATVRDEFEKDGHWVLSKTMNTFSAIPFDQAHEQENKIVKGSGGAVGLTENPVAFRRWMLSGPEMARLLKQFEEEYLTDYDVENTETSHHHEHGMASQKTFQRQVGSLCGTMRRMGNPFLDDFPELITLDSRNCADESVVAALRTLIDTGKTQYQEFVKNVIIVRSHSIHDPIKRNSLALFRNPRCKTTSKQGKKIKTLQNNVALFGQLYVSMQTRDSDLAEFFAHEIQSFPPSLSDFGKLHLPSTKSDLLRCIEQPEESEPPSTYDCKVMDGAVIVHSLPTNVCTFHDYADRIFIPYLEKQVQSASRLDVVWDIYTPHSLKESTREKRGKGVRRKVSGETKLPGNWMDFLRDSMNKKELFAFLTSKVAQFSWPPDKAVYVTSEQGVVSIGDNSAMQNCNHEEADTRIVVHVLHALTHGAKTILVRTVDTDVVVILAGTFHDLVATQPLAVIWVAFGMSKNYRFYHINAICASLGEPQSRALPVFHSFSGCDTISSFNGKGKKSVWQAWQAYDDVTETFVYLAGHPFQLLDADDHHFLKLTVILYDKTSPLSSVNEARMELFCHKNRAMDKLPPTKDALLQHTRRAVYQAGVWTMSTQTHLVVPSPLDFAWTKVSESWVPVWMTIPEVSRSCSELVKCSCKGDCSNGKCGKANLNCSPLCKCKCIP